jgi:hypothetical protein
MVSAFNTLVCAARNVRGAMDIHPIFRSWWKIVLWLHGKPKTAGDLPPERPRVILAGGFRFYAQLYCGLGCGFLTLAPLLFMAGDALPMASPAFWGISSALSGLFLCAVSALGSRGAAALLRSQPECLYALLVLMVAIVAFLSSLIAVLCLVIEQTTGVNAPALLGVASLLLIFGVGSYLIEIFYVMTVGPELIATDHGSTGIP